MKKSPCLGPDKGVELGETCRVGEGGVRGTGRPPSMASMVAVSILAVLVRVVFATPRGAVAHGKFSKVNVLLRGMVFGDAAIVVDTVSPRLPPRGNEISPALADSVEMPNFGVCGLELALLAKSMLSSAATYAMNAIACNSVITPIQDVFHMESQFIRSAVFLNTALYESHSTTHLLDHTFKSDSKKN